MNSIKEEAPQVFNARNFTRCCDAVAEKDADLQSILDRYGYPPLWMRPANFETLLHIILEQQVSLASALAALNKLKAETGLISPENLLSLSDETLKTCYFSRQKMGYARELAGAIHSGRLSIDLLQQLTDDQVRKTLTSIKGIGNWTADVFLMMALQRTDLFPLGDVALLNALRTLKNQPKSTPRDWYTAMVDVWRPYRTLAAYLLWHFYLSGKKKTLK